jgi:hypothetical protein
MLQIRTNLPNQPVYVDLLGLAIALFQVWLHILS